MALALVLCCTASAALAFNPEVEHGSGQFPWKVAVQPDGRILLAGWLTVINGTETRNLVRMYQDGTLDDSFYYEGAHGGQIPELLIQSDGRILYRWGVVTERLLPDGSIDPDFNISHTGNYNYTAMAYLPDGKILIAGRELLQTVVRRMLPDGSLDPDFGVEISALTTIDRMAVLPDGSILIVGTFHTVDGEPRDGIARLEEDGPLMPLIYEPPGLDTVHSIISVGSDGSALLVGAGPSAAGPHQVMYNPDGTINEDFAPEVAGEIFVAKEQPDGMLLLGSRRANASTLPRLRRVSPHDGSPDPTFTEPVLNADSHASAGVNWLDITEQGRIYYVGRGLLQANGHQRARVGRLHPDGSVDGFALFPILDFGGANYIIGQVDVRTIDVRNTFDHDTIVINNIILDHPEYEWTGAACSETLPIVLEPRDSCTLEFSFAPQSAGESETTAEIVLDGTGPLETLLLRGEGVDTLIPRIAVTPGQVEMAIELGSSDQQPLTITNAATGELNWFVTQGLRTQELGGMSEGTGSGADDLPLGGGACSTSSIIFPPPGIGDGMDAELDIHYDNWRSTPPAGRSQIELDHMSALTVFATGGGYNACSIPESNYTYANQYLRTFRLSDFGIDHDFHITEADFSYALQGLVDEVTVQVNLYTLQGPFRYDNMDLVASAPITLATTSGAVAWSVAPFDVVVPASSTLVMEIAVPDLTDHQSQLTIAHNWLGESAPSYLASDACGFSNPQTYDSLGLYPHCTVGLIMRIRGKAPQPSCLTPDWLSLDHTSGTVTTEPDTITATIQTLGLDVGRYQAKVCIQSDDPATPLTEVPITVEVFDSTEGTLQGTVSTAGACGQVAAPVPYPLLVVSGTGATVRTALGDENGQFSLDVSDRLNPVNITAIASGMVAKTVVTTLAPGQVTDLDIELQPDQPCLHLEPATIDEPLHTDEDRTVSINLDNRDGGGPLQWNTTPQPGPDAWARGDVHPAATTAVLARTGTLETGTHSALSGLPAGLELQSLRGEVDCAAAPGLIVRDDGSAESAYGSGAQFDHVTYVDYVVPGQYPAELTDLCFVLTRLASGPASAELEIIAFADDGPGGQPGTPLGEIPLSVTDIPVWSQDPLLIQAADISRMGLKVERGGIYIGFRWSPGTYRLYIPADETFHRPAGLGGGWIQDDTANEWQPIVGVFDAYRALILRPVAAFPQCQDPTQIDWLQVTSTPGTIGAGQQGTLDVALSAAGLAPGDYSTTLCIHSNDPWRATYGIPVNITVSEPGPIQDDVFSDRFEQAP